MKRALYLGIVLGVISIAVFVLDAFMNGGMMASLVFGLVALVSIIAIPIFCIRAERAAHGGYISFKQAFVLSMVCLSLGTLISIAYTYVHRNVIDTGYTEKAVARKLESQNLWMQRGVPIEQKEETMRLTEEHIRKGDTLGAMLSSFVYYLLFFLVLSLIFAAFLKRDPPVASLANTPANEHT